MFFVQEPLAAGPKRKAEIIESSLAIARKLLCQNFESKSKGHKLTQPFHVESQTHF